MRSCTSVSLTALACLFVSQVAQGYPLLFNDRHQGCEIPTQGYKAHGAPEPNAALTFTVTNSTGDTVAQWEPSGVYSIEVPAYAAQTNAWIHTDMGRLNGQGGTTAEACTNAWFSTQPAASHNLTWTAPDEPGCATLSQAQASGADQAYQTASVELCAQGVESEESAAAGRAVGAAALAVLVGFLAWV